jgi:hypothetical protein
MRASPGPAASPRAGRDAAAHGAGPQRDPWANDGGRQVPPGRRVGPAPRITVHRHRTANGQRVLVGSQFVTVTGCVLDRCYSHGGGLTATIVRGADDENSQRVPPEVRRAVEEMPQACQRDGGWGPGSVRGGCRRPGRPRSRGAGTGRDDNHAPGRSRRPPSPTTGSPHAPNPTPNPTPNPHAHASDRG